MGRLAATVAEPSAPQYDAGRSLLQAIRSGLAMALHIEFVVPGPPISNQQPTLIGKANLRAWKATVEGAARPLWAKMPLAGHLKAVILNFYAGSRPSVDVDNMSKPILDVMQKIIYNNDRQIVQAEISHLPLGGAFVIAGVSNVLVAALQMGAEFVYVRIEDPADPFPLPR